METVQTVTCGYESPTQAANGAAMVQIAKVKFVHNGETVFPDPDYVPLCGYTQCVTSSPDGVSA